LRVALGDAAESQLQNRKGTKVAASIKKNPVQQRKKTTPQRACYYLTDLTKSVLEKVH
jgi:hypothetical protein